MGGLSCRWRVWAALHIAWLGLTSSQWLGFCWKVACVLWTMLLRLVDKTAWPGAIFCQSLHSVLWGALLDIETSLPGAGSLCPDVSCRGWMLVTFSLSFIGVVLIPPVSASVRGSASCPGLAGLFALAMWTLSRACRFVCLG